MRTLPSGTTAVSAWILLSLAAAFSHDASSRDADVTEAESVQAHVRPMDAWGGLVWKRSSTVLLARPWLSDRLDKPDNAADRSDVDWYGLFARSDIPRALPAMDVAGQVARSDPDMRRNGGIDWALHSAGDDYSMPANFSRYFDRAMIEYSSGAMLTLGYSTEVGVRRDILYANGYWAEGEFRQLTGSGPLVPGPPPACPSPTSVSEAIDRVCGVRRSIPRGLPLACRHILPTKRPTGRWNWDTGRISA